MSISRQWAVRGHSLVEDYLPRTGEFHEQPLLLESFLFPHAFSLHANSSRVRWGPSRLVGWNYINTACGVALSGYETHTLRHLRLQRRRTFKQPRLTFWGRRDLCLLEPTALGNSLNWSVGRTSDLLLTNWIWRKGQCHFWWCHLRLKGTLAERLAFAGVEETSCQVWAAHGEGYVARSWGKLLCNIQQETEALSLAAFWNQMPTTMWCAQLSL